jgi:AcrR family transcriptional regulator
MRAVGARAGVDPALIAHYFGNKDGLLAEVITLPVDPVQLLDGLDRSRAGADLVRRILGYADSSPVIRGRMVAMLRTALSHEHAAATMRLMLSRTILAGVGDLAASDHQELRASLIGSHMGGLLIGRYVLQVPGLAGADPEQIVAAAGPVLQHYLTGPIATVPERRLRA